MSTLCYLFKRVKQSRKPSRTPLPSPSRGMSEAKVEQQSTETLSFRCWCERCRLMRGRRVKQSDVGWEKRKRFPPFTLINFKW